MDSVFLRENRGHLSENLSTKNYSFGAKMRIIRRLPPNGSHPLRIPRNTRAQVKLAKSLAWPKEWGPCCVAFGRAFGSHPRGQGFKSLQVHHTPCPKHEKQQFSVPEGCCFLYCKESIPTLQCLVIHSKRLIPTNGLFHPVYLMQIFYLVFFAQMNIINMLSGCKHGCYRTQTGTLEIGRFVPLSQ